MIPAIIVDTGLPPEVFATISGTVAMYPVIESVVLFGSRAKGNWKKGSDIDLCLMGPGVTLDTVGAVSHVLNEETLHPWSFDVLAWNAVHNESLREHISRVGITVFTVSM